MLSPELPTAAVQESRPGISSSESMDGDVSGGLRSTQPSRRNATTALSGREFFSRETQQLRRKCTEYLRGKLSARIRGNRVAAADQATGRTCRTAMSAHDQSGDFASSAREGSQPRKRLFPGKRKFRRAARAIKLLINVCHICKDMLWYAITNESWYKMVDKILAESNERGSVTMSTSTFSTLVPNTVTREYEKLEFDAAAYKRDYTAVNVVSDAVRHALLKKPGTRTDREVEEIVQCLRKSIPSVRPYSEEQQKKIAQCCMYDRYFQQRVILREGLQPDGVYFVLNGLLVENGTQTADTREIRAGEKFGEEDLKVGSLRRMTVVTKTSGVELLYIHKQDYVEIFDMNVEFDEDKVLNVCKKDFVMERYPLQKLADNPGTWTVLKFKYGRLIAEDSNRTEFVYVIKSGEARVIKSMARQFNDVLGRRRRLQEERDANSDFVRSFKLLDFISDQATSKSAYEAKSYRPRSAASAPVTTKKQYRSFGDLLSFKSRVGSEAPESVQAAPSADGLERSAATREGAGGSAKEGEVARWQNGGRHRVKFAAVEDLAAGFQAKSSSDADIAAGGRSRLGAGRGQRPSKRKGAGWQVTPSGGDAVKDAEANKETAAAESERSNVPPFVQVESLHSGKVFGLRACLSEDEQGPSAALVSAGCEVLRIHRKFFMKFLDENLMSLIRLKAKPFPSQEELLNRLDVNLQWQEYCQGVMSSVLTRSADFEAGRR